MKPNTQPQRSHKMEGKKQSGYKYQKSKKAKGVTQTIPTDSENYKSPTLTSPWDFSLKLIIKQSVCRHLEDNNIITCPYEMCVRRSCLFCYVFLADK